MKNKCDVCGRETNRIYHIYGRTLCSKHMHQMHKYGKVLDNIPRTNNDLNDYKINTDGTVTFNLYNQKNIKNGEFTIDREDLEKVKYHKWRWSHGHIVTGRPAKGTQRDLAHVVLGFGASKSNLVIDHIDCDPTNNRKNNLRICTQGDNCCNKSIPSNNTSGFIGISFRKDRERYDPEIRLQNVRCHLGYCKNLKEAVYKRYYAEQLVFGEYANSKEQQRKYEFTKDLTDSQKSDLQKIVLDKLKKKNLWP